MKMKAIITGTTGMVGKGLLLECLENESIESVLVINRQPLGITHQKLVEIIHPDFFYLAPIEDKLGGYDVCFFCLGVSSASLTEETYSKMTFDLTTGFAKTLLKKNGQMTFCYISGRGTDSTENGVSMWARVKGRTENALLHMGFKDAYMFRPGFIRPLDGVKSKTPLYQAIYTILKPLFPLLMKIPNFATDSVTLSRSMINVAAEGYNKKVLEVQDINLSGSK
jgi:uncharacterized protein YbjT (DUF2867 family)